MNLVNGKNKMNNLGLMGGMNNKKMMMVPNGQMMVNMPSAPMQTNSKKKSSKNPLKNANYGRYTNKQTNFVSVNRDPPSGISGDSDECSQNNLGNF